MFIWHQTYGNGPFRLLSPISSKGSFICTISQTGWLLVHQSWSTGWNENTTDGVRKEANVLFNDALNTFYSIIMDHSDSERGNPLPPIHGLLFSDQQQGFFYMHHPTDRIAHTTTFVNGRSIKGTGRSGVGLEDL